MKKRFFVILTALLFCCLLAACNASKSVKISFDSQGGSRCKTITLNKDVESIELPKPTRDNHVFTGWYAESDLTTKIDDPLPADKFPTEDVTYYAGWNEISYTVSFRVGNKTVGEKKYSYEDRVTASDYPDLSAYPGYYWLYETFTVTEGRNIYALYREEEKPPETVYTATFSVTGKTYASYSGTSGTALTRPADPRVDDRIFDGWSLTEGGATITAFPSTITSTVTYYAVFHNVPDSRDYLTYRDVVENGVTNVVITGLTSEGTYQTEIGIPSQIDGKKVTAVGYADEGDRTVSALRIFRSSTLKSVYLPSTLRTVGAWAFFDCSALEEVVFAGNNLAYIGCGAFAGCSSLLSFDLPDHVTYIGDYAFAGLTASSDERAQSDVLSSLPAVWRDAAYEKDMALASVNVPGASVLSEIGAYAFYRCVALSSLTLPAVMTSMDYLSFTESGIASLNFIGVGNYKSIGGVVFSSNGKLLCYYPVRGAAVYEIPADVTQISDNAFRGNKNLTTVTFSDRVDTIGQNCFRSCGELITVSFGAASSLATVKEGAFADCPLLSELAFPARLVNLYGSVFENDTALREVTFAGDAVSAVGDRAFYGCVDLTSITLPGAVERIGKYAFYGCSSLFEFGLNATNSPMLTCIDDYAFYDCYELTGVYLPGTVKYIGEYAFYGKTKTMKLELTNNNMEDLECVGAYAFYNTSIMEFTLRDRLVSAAVAMQRYGKNYTIGEYAFANCRDLKTFGFALSFVYDTVPEGFLYGCTALTNLAFTYNIREVGDYALYGCTGLKSVAFNLRREDDAQLVERIGAYTFAGCKNLASVNDKTHLILPSSLTSIGEGAFYGCTSLQRVVIPQNLEVLSKKSFYGCTALADVAYDNPLECALHTLEEDCFGGCVSLGRNSAVALPVNLGLRTEGKGFVKNPFSGCTNLRSFSLPYGNNNNLIVNSGVVYYKNLSDLYAFPTAKESELMEIPSAVTYIEPYAFYGATLRRLTFIGNDVSNNSLTMTLLTIGDHAFADSSLRDVALSARVIEVGAYAFENCSLSSLSIDDAYYYNNKLVKGIPYVLIRNEQAMTNELTIGNYAFYHTALTEVAIPNRVTLIGEGAFAACYNLTGIDFSNVVSQDERENTDPNPLLLRIEGQAFSGNTILRGVTLPGRLTYIGEYAFSDCFNLETVEFEQEENVGYGLTIGEYAFSSNHYLYRISLPENILSLGKGVFSDDTRLTYVNFPDKLTVGTSLTIPEEAFLGDGRIDSLVVPAYVTEIGRRAYYNNNLYEITFAESAEPLTIGRYAFAESTNLTTVTIPTNCVEIGSRAFYGSSNLTEVVYASGYYRQTERVVAPEEVGTDIAEEVYMRYYYPVSGKYRYGEKYYTAAVTSGSGAVTTEVFRYESSIGALVPLTGTYGIETYYTMTEYTSFRVGQTCAEGLYVCRYARVNADQYAAGIKYFTFAEAEPTGTDDRLYILFDHMYRSAYELTIGKEAFRATSLTSVHVDGRVRSLGNGVFNEVSTLTEAVIDGKFTGIPTETFMSDKNLISVTVGSRIVSVGKYAFYESGLTTLDSLVGGALPFGSVGSYAFASTPLVGISIDTTENVTIEESAFEHCRSLCEVRIESDGTMTIGRFALGDCVQMNVLDLKADYLNLGQGFAYNAVSLYEGFSVLTTQNCYHMTDDHVLFTYSGRELVLYPAGKTGSFCELDGAVATIGDYAFYGNSYLTGILIRYSGSGVVAFGEKAFAEMGTEPIVYVASNLVALYKNEWGYSSVQAYSANLNGFVLTVQNNGKYYVSAYLGSESTLTVPGSMTGGGNTYEITGIAKDAFRNNKNIVSLTIGSGIKTIGNNAFRGCSNLTRVVIGENVTGIKNYSFYNCENLTEVVFVDDSSVTSVGAYAFAACARLRSIRLPALLESVGSYAFSGDVALAEALFSEGVSTIGNNAFDGCISLTAVTFPASVSGLSSYIFRDCANLIYIKCLAQTVPAIEENTFYGVPDGIFYFVPSDALKDYSVDSMWRRHIEKILPVEYIYGGDDLRFSNYVLEPIEGNSYRLIAYIGNEPVVRIRSVVNENTAIVAVGENAFGKFVENLTIGEGVVSIDANAFTYASGLQTVELPCTVTKIGAYAFAGLTDLRTVNISDGKFIDANVDAAFSNDYGRWAEESSLYYELVGDETYELTSGAYSYEKQYYRRVNVYSLTTIADHAFYNCTALEGFTFPVTVKSVGKYAFSCDDDKKMSMTSLVFLHSDVENAYTLGDDGMLVTKQGTIEKNATIYIRLEEYAFAHNVNLFNVEFNCYVSYMGEGVFSDCSTLVSIYLNYVGAKSNDFLVTEVPKRAQRLFENCDKLSVILPTSGAVTKYQTAWGSRTEEGYAVKTSDINKIISKELQSGDFLYTVISEELRQVTLTSYLGEETSVVFPSEVTFKGKTYMVTRIGHENLAAAGEVNGSVISNKVQSVVIPGSVDTIGADAFRDSLNLRTVTVQSLTLTLTTIEEYAFASCPVLMTVIFPSSLTSIGKYAFTGCDSLNGFNDETGIGFKVEDVSDSAFDTQTLTLDEGAFSYCLNMTSFRMPAQLTVIGDMVFRGSVRLTEVRYASNYYADGVVVGESDVKLQRIGRYAFADTAIAEIMLPETVETIGAYAFSNCQNLMAVYLMRDPAHNDYGGGTRAEKTIFDGIKTGNTKIYVPTTATQWYSAQESWSMRQVIPRRFFGDFAYEINGMVGDTGSLTLTSYRGDETELYIPNSFVINGTSYVVTAISSYFGTPKLEKVIFYSDSSVDTIADYAFAGCTALREISLPGASDGDLVLRQGKEVRIGERAFENCTSLTDVHLPKNMSYLSAYLFHDCVSLSEITLPATIGVDVADKLSQLQSNGGVFGNGCFYGCVSLARMQMLFAYPNTEPGADVVKEAGKNVSGGLKIVVPAENVEQYRKNWGGKFGSNVTFIANSMLFGDYLMQEVEGGYKLLQYLGDAESIELDDLNFAGKHAVDIDAAVFATDFAIVYDGLTLRANTDLAEGAWTLASYEGSEAPDLTELIVYGRRVMKIDEDVILTD